MARDVANKEETICKDEYNYCCQNLDGVIRISRGTAKAHFIRVRHSTGRARAMAAMLEVPVQLDRLDTGQIARERRAWLEDAMISLDKGHEGQTSVIECPRVRLRSALLDLKA